MSLSTRDRIDNRQQSLPPAILAGQRDEDKILITVNEPFPVLEDFIEQINELRSLLPNWDSYGAKPIGYKAALHAVKLFCQIMYDETPAPQVVPTNSGNIQLEWHVHGIDMEIEIDTKGSIHFYFGDRGLIEHEWTESFNYAVVLMMPFINQLTEREMASKLVAVA